MKTLFITLLLTLSANAADAGPKPSSDPFPWQVYNRSTVGTPLLSDGLGGLYFDFAQSAFPDPDAGPVWNGYIVKSMAQGTRRKDIKSTDITGNFLVMRFNITADSETLWNWKSETFNNGTRPASIRAYFQKSTTLYSGFNNWRWWSNPIAFELQQANGQSLDVTLTIPLTPDQWSDTDGHRGSFDADHTAEFYSSMRYCAWIGFTLGGGSFFGHGVNVTGGNARFTLYSVHTE